MKNLKQTSSKMLHRYLQNLDYFITRVHFMKAMLGFLGEEIHQNNKSHVFEFYLPGIIVDKNLT